MEQAFSEIPAPPIVGILEISGSMHEEHCGATPVRKCGTFGRWKMKSPLDGSAVPGRDGHDVGRANVCGIEGVGGGMRETACRLTRGCILYEEFGGTVKGGLAEDHAAAIGRKPESFHDAIGFDRRFGLHGLRVETLNLPSSGVGAIGSIPERAILRRFLHITNFKWPLYEGRDLR